MSEQDPAVIREWLIEHGHGEGLKDRGRIPGSLRAIYEAEQAAANGAGPPPPGADYPDGMSDELFTAVADEPAGPDGPDEEDLGDSGEVTPRVIRPARGRGRGGAGPRLADRLRGRAGGRQRGRGPTPKRAKPKKARRPLDDLGASVWRVLAIVARPIPPLERSLKLQSVVAGPLIDDAVKGTVVDTLLQPLAAVYGAGETVAALVVPDIAIGAMAVHAGQRAKQQREPDPLFMQGCAELLRYGLTSLMEVGGPKFAEVLAKQREQKEKYGADVDAVMAWIMAPPSTPEADDEMIRTVAAKFAGETMGE